MSKKNFILKSASKTIRLAVLTFLILIIVYFIYPDIYEHLGDRYDEYFVYSPLEKTCIYPDEKISHLDDGSIKLIVIPYIGSIENEQSEEWLEIVDSHFIEFHVENEIPAVFSFYPTDNLDGNKKFDVLLKKTYLSNCLDILQKGTNEPDKDPFLYKMPFELQKEGISKGKENLEGKLKTLLPGHNINSISSFNSLGGKVNNDTIKALNELGFKIYFELFLEETIEVFKEPHQNFDVYQYGVSFTETGVPGPGNDFNNKSAIIKEIEELREENIGSNLNKIKNVTIIPLFMENWDIEEVDEKSEGNGKVNATKWEMYKDMILTLNSRNDTIILNPSQVWDLKR